MKSVIYIVDFISFQWSILFFIRVYYTMNLQKSFSKFLVNPLALKVVSAIAVINFLGYLILGNTNAVIYFLLLGLIVSYFSKNMILILGVPVILVNLFAAGKKTAEGFKGGKEGIKNAEETMKKDKKETDVTEEKPKVAEKFEVGRKKGKGSYDIDYASTVEDAYDELNKIIGSDGIQRLTKDTQGLMKQQMELTKAMKDMGPMVDKIEPMMGQLQSMMQGMKNMTGGKEGNETMTNVVGQRDLKQIER